MSRRGGPRGGALVGLLALVTMLQGARVGESPVVVRFAEGVGLRLFATLAGRAPPDNHGWLVTDPVPAFVRFEGPLSLSGPVWRIELESPRWPAAPRP
jgi:hypothetical protein